MTVTARCDCLFVMVLLGYRNSQTYRLRVCWRGLRGVLKSGKGVGLFGLFPLLVYIAVSAFLSVFGFYLTKSERKVTVKPAGDEDPRNPVLYLRSFIDDGVAATVVDSSPLWPT